MSKKSNAFYTVLLVILKVLDRSYYFAFGICNAALKLNVAKIQIKDRYLSDT